MFIAMIIIVIVVVMVNIHIGDRQGMVMFFHRDIERNSRMFGGHGHSLALELFNRGSQYQGSVGGQLKASWRNAAYRGRDMQHHH